MSIKTQVHRANLYEQALLLADSHSRKSNADNQWVAFIDNLSRICNEFANSANTDQRDWISLISTSPKTYKLN
ncbi:TPA: hypothetical protein EYN98_23835 [Candidatus Poribacteria bacterium]|nr:hypothetical protein [Candidatus Poribacteria bacterium]HIA69012.1 hypothetical protein [Candidatus Poribacteria bacterium]HIB87356.1 hypothetical protein [Candidatus Poribacteria bacterium]HIB98320.1 hypothetical protein [Candidatus Poribacteria bacterium]HIN29062.1 hypothetical protein [Candidatus Poribacteria bacterium]